MPYEEIIGCNRVWDFGMHLWITKLGLVTGISAAAIGSSWAAQPLMASRSPLVQQQGASDPQCDRRNFRIVIDVGHSAKSPGAMSARGVAEYRFNTLLADAVAETLKRDGFQAVTVVTNQGAGRADLVTRNARANAAKPDAFLSLHHDAVQKKYLEKWTTEFGVEQSYSDRFSGYSVFVSNKNEFPGESVKLAELLGAELMARGLSFTRHHAEDIPGERHPWVNSALGVYRTDNLIVLKGTKAPAALLEAGVIVNRSEELQLASPRRRAVMAEAVSSAMAKFCAARTVSASR
ncbi:N-acetylmuramoyl-L-alanine amidase [Microvirga massiliensis]|uniref:N-acetylmuramoyl-L-alanine amidase n=1 Tax=Microvirga massiliensis TaxID=1033741 RepID=UPI00066113D0